VSEKFFALCQAFGAENVGMVTGDSAVNADAALRVGVEVELVHDDGPEVGVRALAQRDVGQDLRRRPSSC
jgi:hypothetical protein